MNFLKEQTNIFKSSFKKQWALLLLCYILVLAQGDISHDSITNVTTTDTAKDIQKGRWKRSPPEKYQKLASLKQKGKNYFENGLFEEATNVYSAAILYQPNDIIFYKNRALCSLKLKKWQIAIDDCEKALELDNKDVKVNYILGTAYLELRRYDETIKALTVATDYAIDQKLMYVDEITHKLQKARKEKFLFAIEKKIEEKNKLKTYLNKLIEDDTNRKIDVIKTNQAIPFVKAAEDLLINKVKNEGLTNKDKLNSLFDEVAVKLRKTEIPDYLRGKIFFDLLKDPVITPSGITYDRAEIIQHLQLGNNFDPLSRAALRANQLVPNLALKEVLENYLIENEWALNE